MNWNHMIDPSSIAFDIDGVVADTMKLFIDIARNDFGIFSFGYDDITSYNLDECLEIEAETLKQIIDKLLDRSSSAMLNPMDGSASVLKKILRKTSPILFVTARPDGGPITEWMQNRMGLSPDEFELIPTGSSDAKTDVLLEKNISYFVDDRLETCLELYSAGITPVLYKQPWNREVHPFFEVGDWKELESIIDI